MTTSREEPTFEAALERLETIVQELEDGELDLDRSLQLFEEGVRLSRLCSRRLDAAERRVEMLLENEDGTLTTTPLTTADEE